MGDSDRSGDDYEEDERIVKLVEKIGKEEPAEEVVRYLKEDLGGKNGMVREGAAAQPAALVEASSSYTLPVRRSALTNEAFPCSRLAHSRCMAECASTKTW